MPHNKQIFLNLVKLTDKKKQRLPAIRTEDTILAQTEKSLHRDRIIHELESSIFKHKEEYAILTSEATLSKQTSPQWRLRSVFFVSVLLTNLNPKKLTEPRVVYHVASGSEVYRMVL